MRINFAAALLSRESMAMFKEEELSIKKKDIIMIYHMPFEREFDKYCCSRQYPLYSCPAIFISSMCTQ